MGLGMTPKDKAADLRLRRTYGITLADYKQMLKDQNGVCAICGKPPKEGGRNLHVDHMHTDTKIVATKEGKKLWYAYNPATQITLNVGVFYGRTKTEAVKQTKNGTKRLTVRGLLCWLCNTGLKKWNDDSDKLESAAKYIRNYKEKLGN
jgi:hypothetical protein